MSKHYFDPCFFRDRMVSTEALIALQKKLYLAKDGVFPAVHGKKAGIYCLLQRLWSGLGSNEDARILDALISDKDITDAQTTIKRCADKDIKIITWFDDAYPFDTISSAPPVIYVRGDIENPSARPHVAIVGSRKATDYGRSVTKRIIASLAPYCVTIVSGMAYGVDAAAHNAAIEYGLKTVAVLGCGIDIDYPKSHKGLSRQIIRSGCLISEFPLQTPPLRFNFPIRNRLISGLSRGVVVVEAEIESGSLITARWAAEQGREVFAVPGNVDRALSKGTNRLIKEGAHLLDDVSDIAAVLKLQRGEITDDLEKNSGQVSATGDIKNRIAEFLTGGGSLEVLAEETGLSPMELLPLVSEVEGMRRV